MSCKKTVVVFSFCLEIYQKEKIMLYDFGLYVLDISQYILMTWLKVLYTKKNQQWMLFTKMYSIVVLKVEVVTKKGNKVPLPFLFVFFSLILSSLSICQYSFYPNYIWLLTSFSPSFISRVSYIFLYLKHLSFQSCCLASMGVI